MEGLAVPHLQLEWGYHQRGGEMVPEGVLAHGVVLAVPFEVEILI